MSWLAYSCRCDRYILRLTSIITYSGSHSSLWLVTGSFLHPNGLATSSCTYIAHPFFSKKSQWIKIFLFGLGAVWTVCLWWFLERSWSSLQNNLGMRVNKCRFRQGCQLPCLNIMNVLSFLVLDILELSCLSSKLFWLILWYLLWEWEPKVSWCLYSLHSRGIPFKQHGWSLLCVVSVLSFLHEELGQVVFCFGSIWSLVVHPKFWATEKVVLDPHSLPREKESSCPGKWCSCLSLY